MRPFPTRSLLHLHMPVVNDAPSTQPPHVSQQQLAISRAMNTLVNLVGEPHEEPDPDIDSKSIDLTSTVSHIERPHPAINKTSPRSHRHRNKGPLYSFTTRFKDLINRHFIITHPKHITSVELLRARPRNLGAETYYFTPPSITSFPREHETSLLDEGIIVTDWAAQSHYPIHATDQMRFQMAEKLLRRRKRYRRRARRMLEASGESTDSDDESSTLSTC